MNKLDLIDELIVEAEKVPTFDGKSIDALKKRATLVIRNLFGAGSNYLDEMQLIQFIPFVEGEISVEVKAQSWEARKRDLVELFQTMREEVGLSIQLQGSGQGTSRRDILQDEAIEIFGSLVNYFAALTYPDPNPSKTAAQIARTHEAIKKRFGSDSEYLRQVQGIRFHHPRAYRSNRPVYFNSAKNKLIGVLERILDDLRLSSVSQKELSEGDVFKVQPSFGKPLALSSSEWAQVFVLMPFEERLKPLYSRHILGVTNSLSLSCKRGDDFFSAATVVNEIWSAIFYAQVCIADCTGRNPNVFYELGIAHTIGRPCILISQSIEDIPFDVRHIRSIIYEYTQVGMNQFEQTLEKTLRNIFQLR